MKNRYLLIIHIFVLFFLISCGAKGSLSLKSFEGPAPVKQIKAVHREDEIIISWTYPESEKIKGFFIEKSESEKEGFKKIAYLRNDVSEFVDKDFIVEREYYYRIFAYSLRDVLSESSMVIKVRPKTLPPAPSNLRYSLTDQTIKIEWDGFDPNVKYNVYKSYKKGEYRQPINREPLDKANFLDRIEKDKRVYYTVRPLLDTDIKDEGYPSEELEVNPEDFIPAKPTGIRYVITNKWVYLLWSQNPEEWVSGYRIYRKTDNDTEFRLIGESIVPSFIDRESPVSRTLYYITAVGPKKEGNASDIITIYPLIER